MSGLKGNQKRANDGKFASNAVPRPARSLREMSPAEVVESNLKWDGIDVESRRRAARPGPVEITGIEYGDGVYRTHTEITVGEITFVASYLVDRFGMAETAFEPKDPNLRTVFDDDDNIVCRNRETGEEIVVAYVDDFHTYRLTAREETEYIVRSIESKVDDARDAAMRASGPPAVSWPRVDRKRSSDGKFAIGRATKPTRRLTSLPPARKRSEQLDPWGQENKRAR